MPFVAHAEWEHLLRTFRRNLKNARTEFAFGFVQNNVVDANFVATWAVIEHLQRALGAPDGDFLSPILRFNPFMEQSGDVANRLFSTRTINALRTQVTHRNVPEGKATILFLTLVNPGIAPIEDPNFGDPFEATESMWTGLYTLRFWRHYVRLNGSLQKHFTSLESYRTTEVIVHGCTNHYLVVKLERGELPW